MFRLCPACSTRHHQIVEDQCVVCQGSGRVTLGAAALHIYEPQVVAEAVTIALEAAAREADLSMSLTDDREAPVRAVLQTLSIAGVIQYTPLPVTPGTVTITSSSRPHRTTQPRPLTHGEQLAFDLTGLYPEPQDRALITARAHAYTEHDRPHARGLPTMSSNGHPSHLARITDPAEPGTNTRTWARVRRHQHRQAECLFEATTTVQKRKQRQQKAAA